MPSIKKWTVPAVNLDESIIRNGVMQWFLKFITKLSTLIYSDGLFHLFSLAKSIIWQRGYTVNV